KLPERSAQRREQTPQGAFQVLAFTSTLTPLRTGTLMVGPAAMSMNVLARSRRQDPFFGFFGETQTPTELHSEPLVLTVLPLPETHFSYFDSDARAYRTISRPPIVVTVREPAQPEGGPQIVGRAVAPRAPTEQLGRDLVFIKDEPGALRPVGTRRHRSPLFWG